MSVYDKVHEPLDEYFDGLNLVITELDNKLGMPTGCDLNARLVDELWEESKVEHLYTRNLILLTRQELSGT